MCSYRNRFGSCCGFSPTGGFYSELAEEGENRACVLLTGTDLDPVADFLGKEALVLANRDDHACVLTEIDLDPVAYFL